MPEKTPAVETWARTSVQCTVGNAKRGTTHNPAQTRSVAAGVGFVDKSRPAIVGDGGTERPSVELRDRPAAVLNHVSGKIPANIRPDPIVYTLSEKSPSKTSVASHFVYAMTEDEILQILFMAARVINRCHYRRDVPAIEVYALRQLAETDQERTLPIEELARIVIKRLNVNQSQRSDAAST